MERKLITQYMLPQHYFHEDWLPRSRRQHLTPYRMGKEQFVCLTNGNALQIHRLGMEGISLHSQHLFTANLTCLQVLASKHHSSDYLFLADEKGRWAIWRPQQNYVMVGNTVFKQTTTRRLYRQDISPDNDLQFSDKFIKFRVSDTEGMVFFTIGNQIITIEFLISKHGFSLVGSKVTSHRIPYPRYRFIAAVASPKQRLVGVIQEEEEKTILKVHNIDWGLGPETLEWEYQKINLMFFASTVPQQLLLLTYNQISLHIYKNSQPLCNYRTRGNYGRACHLGQGLYAHVGQELTVFSRHKLKCYGSMRLGELDILEQNGITEMSLLGTLPDGGRLMSLLTITNDLYFLALYENTWRLVRKIPQLSTIYTLHTLNRNALVAVTSAGVDLMQVSVVEKQTPCMFLKDQEYPFVVDGMTSLEGGRFLLISSREQNTVMRYDEKEKSYTQGFSLPSSQLLTAAAEHFVLEDGVYAVNYFRGTYTQIIAEPLISAVANSEYICLLDTRGLCKWMQCLNEKIVKVDHSLKNVSAMHLLPHRPYLLSTDITRRGELSLTSRDNYRASIRVSTEMVSDIAHLYHKPTQEQNGRIIDESQEDLKGYSVVVGYCNGAIEIYTLLTCCLVVRFEGYDHNPIRFIAYQQDAVIASSGFKQFMLAEDLSIHQLRFSDHALTSLVYASRFFLFVEHSQLLSSGRVVRMSHLKDANGHAQLCLELQSGITITPLLQKTKQIPELVVIGKHVYIALSEVISKLDINTKKQLRRREHILKEVVGISQVQLGIVMVGIDLLDRCTLVIVDPIEMEIKASVNLGAKKVPRSLRTLPDKNQFFMRCDTVLSLYQITPTLQATELIGFNSGIAGYPLDALNGKVVLSDPYKYLVAYSCADNVLPLARHTQPYMINDIAFLGSAIATVNKGGCISVLQFNLGAQTDIIKTTLSVVGSIYMSEEEIIVLNREKNGDVVYGCESGQVGRLRAISKDDFRLLKKAQGEGIKMCVQTDTFTYEDWRMRDFQKDKLIDDFLIRVYLQNAPKGEQDQFRAAVLRTYTRLKQ